MGGSYVIMDEERMHLRRMALRSFLRERPAARQGVALSVAGYVSPFPSCPFLALPPLARPVNRGCCDF